MLVWRLARDTVCGTCHGPRCAAPGAVANRVARPELLHPADEVGALAAVARKHGHLERAAAAAAAAPRPLDGVMVWDVLASRFRAHVHRHRPQVEPAPKREARAHPRVGLLLNGKCGWQPLQLLVRWRPAVWVSGIVGLRGALSGGH
eukprot:365390-Chlamydomonas_euryale.AAC.20